MKNKLYPLLITNWFFILIPVLLAHSQVLPVHFPLVGGDPNENSWSIFIREATIGEVTLQPGDELAVFDAETIVGVVVLQVIPSLETQFDTELVAWSTLDCCPGYQAGNPVIFKVWKASENLESEICNVIYYNDYGDAWDLNVFPYDCCQYSMIALDCEPADCPNPPFAYAGSDVSICGTSPVQLHETVVSNCSQILWSTNGTGVFNNASLLYPVYYPSYEDFLTGNVTLTLTSTRPGYEPDSDDLVLTFHSFPGPAGNIMGESTVCSGSTSLYNTIPVPNSDYLYWFIVPYFAADVYGSGTECTVVFNNEFTGIAHLKVYGENSCGAGPMSEIFEIMVLNCTGLNEYPGDEFISIHPNPAGNFVQLSWRQQPDPGTSLVFADIRGKVIKTIPSENFSGEMSVDVSDLAPGIYTLVFRSGNQSMFRKLMVTR